MSARAPPGTAQSGTRRLHSATPGLRSPFQPSPPPATPNPMSPYDREIVFDDDDGMPPLVDGPPPLLDFGPPPLLDGPPPGLLDGPPPLLDLPPLAPIRFMFAPESDMPPLVDGPPPLLDAPPYDAEEEEEDAAPRAPSSHAKKRDASYIPRPPNAFILFRSSFIRAQHIPGRIEGSHSALSKIIGKCWRALPREERKVWEAKAVAALEAHRRKYPDWRFKPAANALALAKRARAGGQGPRGASRKAAKGGADAEEAAERKSGTEERCARIADLIVQGKTGEALTRAVEEYDFEVRGTRGRKGKEGVRTQGAPPEDRMDVEREDVKAPPAPQTPAAVPNFTFQHEREEVKPRGDGPSSGLVARNERDTGADVRFTVPLTAMFKRSSSAPARGRGPPLLFAAFPRRESFSAASSPALLYARAAVVDVLASSVPTHGQEAFSPAQPFALRPTDVLQDPGADGGRHIAPFAPAAHAHTHATPPLPAFELDGELSTPAPSPVATPHAHAHVWPAPLADFDFDFDGFDGFADLEHESPTPARAAASSSSSSSSTYSSLENWAGRRPQPPLPFPLQLQLGGGGSVMEKAFDAAAWGAREPFFLHGAGHAGADWGHGGGGGAREPLLYSPAAAADSPGGWGACPFSAADGFELQLAGVVEHAPRSCVG
ncbi:uncharacterized protein BXZ73DRAFT_103897 [Epithele typhae]|uniref:uncharacterized protein n=1 Tax=Epithele typhae TaxID=378194 RepID=UPI002007AED9|nr:uncharacterized protein BXZ73DRAFT_103897 [Epithele typhae]KAH9923464.1 hypothetical protein BXZ73DRAFT_103897 [Epithele typhae]